MNSEKRTIRLQERRSCTIDNIVVEAVPTTFWSSADCSITRAPGDSDWTLSAGDRVGISRIETEIGDVTLQITAKLRNTDAFFLADYAYGQRRESLRLLNFDEAFLDAVRNDPTACLLLWHVHAISQFASRWLRRDYQTTDRVLFGKTKGRILLDRYVKSYLAVGQAAHVPCRTVEQTQDTPNNRVLKAGLRYAAALSHALPVPAAGQALRMQVAATLPKFAQVTDILATPAELRKTSTRGPQRHYRAVLESTRNLLAHKFIRNTIGDRESQSFMWDMPILFQEAVRGIMDSTPGITLDPGPPPKAVIYNGSGTQVRASKVDPDLVIRAATGECLLLDTKYKNVLISTSTSSADTGEEVITLTSTLKIRVSRSDIYQAVAYRQHQRWAAELVQSGLIFPVSLSAGEVLPPPMRVSGFNDDVPLIFVDIGPHARHNVEAFRCQIAAMKEGNGSRFRAG